MFGLSCVVGRVIRSAWMTLPFLLVLSFIFIPACDKNVRPPLDGGHLVKNNSEAYWEADDFPIQLYIDEGAPNYVIEATILAAEIWNTKTDRDVFDYDIIDFYADLPTGCGWVAVVHSKVAQYDGIWRGIQKEESSAVCHGQITLRNGLNQETMYKIVVHELGHALGLAHDPGDNRSIMYPSVFTDKRQYLMPDDINRVIKMVDGKFVPLKYSLKSKLERELAKLGY